MPGGSSRRTAPPRLPDEPNLEVLPPRVWGVLIGVGLAVTACLFGGIGILTGWEMVPGLPYLYNGLLALSLILTFLMFPVAWKQLPESTRNSLRHVGRVKPTPAELDPPPWSIPGSEVCKVLHVASQQGLPSAVVKQRLKRHGANDLDENPLPAFPVFFIERIYTPTRLLVLLLCVLYTTLVGIEEALVACLALLAMIVMDVWAEWKGHRAFVTMKQGVPKQALVLRDNVASLVDRRELVPGDIVLLRAGMEVPADLRLLHTSLLEIDESRLSGEWDAVACAKDARTVNPSLGGGDNSTISISCLDLPGIALAGSVVVSGRGSGVVFRTGRQTELGRKIAALAASRASGGDGVSSRRHSRGPRFSSLSGSIDVRVRGAGSPLGPVSEHEVELNLAAWRFMYGCVSVCLVCALLGWVRSEAWEDIVLSVSTLFFAGLPENLPVILVAALGIGSKPLGKKEVFAQGVKSMESLGCVDTIVVDKNGTITESKLSLSSAIVASTPVGPDDLMEATREVPKSGPLASSGGLEALGLLLEAWLFMSDMGDDLLRDAGAAASGSGGEASGSGEGKGEGEGEEEHIKKMEEEKKRAEANEVKIDTEWRTSEGGTHESLLGNSNAGVDNDMTARGGVVDPIDAAMLSAVGGPAVFTQLPYEGMDGVDSSTTRGLRPLHDMLKRLYEGKLAAPLVHETLFDSSIRSSSRTFGNVKSLSVALPSSTPSRGKSVQEKLLALGKRVANQNGAASSPEKGAKEGEVKDKGPVTKMFFRGAPELLVEQCTKIMQAGEEVPIAPLRQQLLDHIKSLAQEGMVLVGYASGEVPQREGGEAPYGSVSKCTFLGVLALLNPVLHGIKATVMQCRNAGVRVLLVSGDHPDTAMYAARAAGICWPHQAQKVEVQQDGVSCLERPPAQSTTDELAEILKGCSVFSRATPTDRLCIVEALHAPTTGSSNCVAVCGTGGMDAPVLAAADVGVAVGREAADVVRDSAGLVMLERSLPLLTLSLKEGRRVMDNARKAVAVSLGAKTALLLVFLVGIAWAEFPFSPMQIAVLAVFLNAGVVFAYIHEPLDCDTFTRSPRKPTQSFFDFPLFLMAAGVASSVAISVLLVFALALHVLGARPQAASMAFLSALLSTALVALNFRTSREPIFHKGIFTNLWVLLWVGAAAAWCGLVSRPWLLHRALRMENMQVQLWLVVVGICIGGAFWLEIVKGILWFYKSRGFEIPEWDEDAAVAAVTGDVQMTPAAEVGVAPLLPPGGQASDDVEAGK